MASKWRPKSGHFRRGFRLRSRKRKPQKDLYSQSGVRQDRRQSWSFCPERRHEPQSCLRPPSSKREPAARWPPGCRSGLRAAATSTFAIFARARQAEAARSRHLFPRSRKRHAPDSEEFFLFHRADAWARCRSWRLDERTQPLPDDRWDAGDERLGETAFSDRPGTPGIRKEPAGNKTSRRRRHRRAIPRSDREPSPTADS